jgi:hypothetical protein
MLNKKYCEKCRGYTELSNHPVSWLCPKLTLYLPDGRPIIDFVCTNSNPPKGCPYALEHSLEEVSKHE